LEQFLSRWSSVNRRGESRADHDARIAADPFVAEGIVTAETCEVDPKRTVSALDFLNAAT